MAARRFTACGRHHAAGPNLGPPRPPAHRRTCRRDDAGPASPRRRAPPAAHRTPESEAPANANAVIIAAQHQTLPDGTQVELKPGAEIVADYSGPLRRVTLRRGQALFHVAKDAQRTFVVTAAGVEVRAIGTAFAVQVAEAGVEVVVTEGRVAVERPTGVPAALPPSGPAPAPLPPPTISTTLLDAGKRISVDLQPGAPVSQPVEITAAEIAERLAWRATRIEFSHTPLAEAVALLNRHSSVQLVVDDPKLAVVPVNGLFRADNTEALVRILEASFGASAERNGDVITLRRRP
jgi:transmembrane sensor